MAGTFLTPRPASAAGLRSNAHITTRIIAVVLPCQPPCKALAVCLGADAATSSQVLERELEFLSEQIPH